KKWFRDFLCVIQSRDFLVKLGHLWIALIAVLGPAKVAAIALRVFQERCQVRDADDVQGAANAVSIIPRYLKRHKPAVRTARHHYPGWVQFSPRRDPGEQARNVFVGIFALKAVVQFYERFAVTGRTAHVRKNDRAPHL